METLLKDLTSYEEVKRQQAVEGLKKIGAPAFDAVAKLFEHEVARWEVIGLLPQLSLTKSIPLLLKIVKKERELSVREREHAKKYFRIRAIEELGKIGETANRETLVLFAKLEVEQALGYFIDPVHPHLHEEVTQAVVKNLRKISTPLAIKLIETWESR